MEGKKRSYLCFGFAWGWSVKSEELCGFFELCGVWNRDQGSYADYDGYIDIVEVFGVMWVLEQESRESCGLWGYVDVGGVWSSVGVGREIKRVMSVLGLVLILDKKMMYPFPLCLGLGHHIGVM